MPWKAVVEVSGLLIESFLLWVCNVRPEAIQEADLPAGRGER